MKGVQTNYKQIKSAFTHDLNNMLAITLYEHFKITRNIQ